MYNAILNGMELIQQFNTIYYKKTKHRKKCYVCGNLIEDGSKIEMSKYKVEKYYPVKGLMGFITWKFRHVSHE